MPALVEHLSFASGSAEVLASLGEPEVAPWAGFAALEERHQVGASVSRGLRRRHPLGLYLALCVPVVGDAVVRRPAAAPAGLADRAAGLVAREHTLVPRLGVYPCHQEDCLRCGAAAPVLLAHPPFELGNRVEPQLAGIDASDVRLDVPLEVPKRHPEGRGRLVSAERESSRRRVGRGPHFDSDPRSRAGFVRGAAHWAWARVR